jgi:hypothetical protein
VSTKGHYMASKTEKMRRQEEVIKDAIVRGHLNGVCDKDGNSVAGGPGINIPKPSSFNSSSKTYVVRNGKLVEK